jgi:hypothetical protein
VIRGLPWIATAGLCVASAVLQAKVDTLLGEFRAQEEVLYFTSGDQLKWLVPGFESVLADVYWLRTVQYFGRAVLRRQGGAEVQALIPLVEITIALDPKFRVAYLSGATFIGEPPPIGPGDGIAAVRILEQGAVELPNDWIVQQHLGYGIFILLGDHKRAADRLMRASRLPGAPFWLETFAAGILTDGGARDKSRLIWRQMFQDSEVPQVRELAGRNLLRLDALDVLDKLNERAAAYHEAYDRWPTTKQGFETLAGGLPLSDQTGVPFSFDTTRGEFDIAESSRIYSSWARDRRLSPAKPAS